MNKKFYITTPIYYVNDVPHIGHTYTTIAADVLARYHRMCGEEVFFLTGTDEHGQKIAQAAEAENKDPQVFVDGIVSRFKETWQKMEISNDAFIRTTDKNHVKTVQFIFSKLLKDGYIYKGSYEGWYCTTCETFWLESEVKEGHCPNVECQRPVEKFSEESYFFKLSAFSDKLLKWLQEKPRSVCPSARFNEVKSFIESGLKDLSITRPAHRLKWGIEAPTADKEKFTIYVWFDALINYISAAGYPDDPEKFNKFWPGDIHLIGKEIIRFHAVIWPALLMALGVTPPEKVFGHGWWTVEGQKMSKSRGNVVDPIKLSEKFDVEAVRYFLLREVPFGTDGDFSTKSMLGRYNSDLANDLGNLLSRTLAMIDKYFEGVVPELKPDSEILKFAARKLGKYQEALENVAFSEALTNIWEIITEANVYIEKQAPWKLSKEKNTATLKQVLAELYEILRLVALLILPFMPRTAQKIWEQLGIPGKIEQQKLPEFKIGQSSAGLKVKRGTALFPRIENAH
jgi:methionyl-tRNA synthetase